jgi:phosphoribosylglycinamide formyltransferase-1
MRPLRLVVLLSGGGRTLLNLLEAIRAGRLAAQVPLVISSRATAPGVERARAAGLPVEVLRPRDFPDREAFVRAQSARVLRERPDLVVMAGYLVHWSPPHGLEGRVLNIHPALLPKYGGKGMHGDRVHAAVLAAGETESGCTVHLCNEKYDDGRILLQARVPVLANDTPATLAARVFAAECEAYPAAINLRWQELGAN